MEKVEVPVVCLPRINVPNGMGTVRYEHPLMRPANRALTGLAILLLLFGLTLVDAAWRSWTVDRVARRALTRELGLSDLSLFTEARYTRHPSQADRHAPFQDHPAALEHFPTSVLLPPPPHLVTPPLTVYTDRAQPGP